MEGNKILSGEITPRTIRDNSYGILSNKRSITKQE